MADSVGRVVKSVHCSTSPPIKDVQSALDANADSTCSLKCGVSLERSWVVNSAASFPQAAFRNTDGSIGARTRMYVDVDDTCCKGCGTVETSNELPGLRVRRCLDIGSFGDENPPVMQAYPSTLWMGKFGSPAEQTASKGTSQVLSKSTEASPCKLGWTIRMWSRRRSAISSRVVLVEGTSAAAYENLEVVVVDTADGRKCRRHYHCQCCLGTRGIVPLDRSR